MGQICVRKGDICPSTFLNGRVSADCHRQPGAICSFTCNAGCDRNPSVANVYCRQSGGVWLENTDTLCINCKRCPDNILYGHIPSSCKRLPSTLCSYSCNSGCRKVVASLYCTSNGEWSTNDGKWSSHSPACACSEMDSSFEDSGSSNSSAIIAIAVIIVVLILLILIGIYFNHYRRRQRNRPENTVRDENSEPMIPSAPPVDGSLSAPSHDAAMQRIPAADRRGSQGAAENTGPDSDEKTSPPPSYEEVTADPTRFMT